MAETCDQCVSDCKYDRTKFVVYLCPAHANVEQRIALAVAEARLDEQENNAWCDEFCTVRHPCVRCERVTQLEREIAALKEENASTT